MARSVSQIYNTIIAEKESQASLNIYLPAAGDSFDNFLSDLSTKSKVSIWRLWVFLISVAHFILETYWDIFKLQVEDLAAAAHPGTDEWWIKTALKYQDGDALQVIGFTPGYLVVDPSKQIIKAVSVDHNAGIIKVAKEEGGELVPLETDEYQRFSGYVDRMRIPGTQVEVMSQEADLVQVALQVKYDALLEVDAIKANLVIAVTRYLSDIGSNLTGAIDRNDFISELRKVEGVLNVYLTQFKAKPFVASSWVDILQDYPSFSGYFKVDPDYDLEGNIIMSVL